MKTTSILAATAAAFLLVSGASFAAEPQQPQALAQAQAPAQTPPQTQAPAQTPPQAKRCYRWVHKLAFPIRVRCKAPNMHMPSQSQTKGSDS